MLSFRMNRNHPSEKEKHILHSRPTRLVQLIGGLVSSQILSLLKEEIGFIHVCILST